MEASAITPPARVTGLRTRTPLLRMQSDERLVALVRRGNQAAFGVLVSRYESRLLSFCRHLVRSREDAEDVLQDVFASAFKAMMADNRPIRVRPWLYRIARNRCLNHLRRITAIGVDSIEEHVSEHGPSTSEMVQRREDLWLLVRDIQDLSEAQRSALLLREMESLSYEQIADVMDKTIPSVKSLLIRARRALAESAEARALSCDEVIGELEDVRTGARNAPGRVVRRHIAACDRCSHLRVPELLVPGRAGTTSVPARAFLPLAPMFLLKKLTASHLLESARMSSTAAGAGAAAGPALMAGSAASGFISAGIGGLASKAAVGLTAAALGVAGAVVVDTATPHRETSGSHTSQALSAASPSGGSQSYAAASAEVGAAAQAGAKRDGARTSTTHRSDASVKTVSVPAPTKPRVVPRTSAAKPNRKTAQTATTTAATSVPDANDASAGQAPSAPLTGGAPVAIPTPMMPLGTPASGTTPATTPVTGTTPATTPMTGTTPATTPLTGTTPATGTMPVTGTTPARHDAGDRDDPGDRHDPGDRNDADARHTNGPDRRHTEHRIDDRLDRSHQGREHDDNDSPSRAEGPDASWA